MKTTQSGTEHRKPQMELSQERWEQTSLPEFLKKTELEQLHPQLTESKMSGPRHGLRSKTQLVLALTHAWPNAWTPESLKKRWKRWSRRLRDLMGSQMKCWNTSALEQSVSYNQSWSTGTVPTIWKEALIRPILKVGNEKRDPSSYSLISLLSCAGKLLEKIINKRFTWHLESNTIPAPTQTGNRQFRNTEDQLALLTQDIKDAFQEKKTFLTVFFDLSMAFDKVWKEGLLLKLLRAGVHGKMYKWLSDFFFNRTARVKVDAMIRRQVKLREGVPQGGAVSSALFLVYTNDITTTVPRHVSNTLHADDFEVWCTEEHTTTAVYASRTLSTRCAAGLRAGHYSSTQPRRSAHSSHCPPQRRRSH